jgi:hypothetical protein
MSQFKKKFRKKKKANKKRDLLSYRRRFASIMNQSHMPSWMKCRRTDFSSMYPTTLSSSVPKLCHNFDKNLFIKKEKRFGRSARMSGQPDLVKVDLKEVLTNPVLTGSLILL